MERRAKEKVTTSDASGSELNIVDSIRALAAKNARAKLDNEEQLLLFLQSWWSRTYNRPLKDPLLLSYSLEELLYEFYDRIEREKAEQERLEQEAVRIEEEKERAVLDWAEQEEKRELEEMRAKAAADAQSDTVNLDPTKDPDNIAWMEEQIRQAKEIYGDTFGEDIDETFE
ncbi:MAG: hypothetical protein QXG63_04525 [Nitrososphaerales archaeon]